MKAPSKPRTYVGSNAMIIIVLVVLTSAFFIGFLFGMMPQANHDTPSFRQPVQPVKQGIAMLPLTETTRPVVIEVPVQSKPEADNVKVPIKAEPKVQELDPNIQSSAPHPITINGLHVESTVPPIVTAWRAAKLDWHSLLPKHNSVWERFGTPLKEGKLRMLVGKEVQATDFLTRFHESGLASMYGYNHGPLLAYSGCDAFSSGCMIHDKPGCDRNQVCQWSDELMLCVEATHSSSTVGQCQNPMMMQGGFKRVNPTSCKVWVDQPAIAISIDSESQAMFYHWWATWGSIISQWTNQLHSRRDIHFFVNEINDPMFFQYFGLISDHCWRRVTPIEGVCFCNTQQMHAHQADHTNMPGVRQMMSYLQLTDVRPPADKVRIGLISRRRKRFILNEYELVSAVQSLGYDCVLLPLETMTLYEQMRMLRSLDVLVGIHGSALDNSVFLQPSSVMVQLLPYKVEHRVTFVSSCQAAGMKYMEWQLKDLTKTFLHWDLLEMANKEKMQAMSKEAIIQAGQVSADNRETTMFWINQDIIVPIEEWIPLIESAAKASPAGERLGL